VHHRGSSRETKSFGAHLRVGETYECMISEVRFRTGSVWFCVLLHGLMNLIATIEVEFFTVTV